MIEMRWREEMVDYENERKVKARVSLRYSNNQQVYMRPKHSIYRGGVGQHSYLPHSSKSSGLWGPWTCNLKSSKLSLLHKCK